MLIYMFMLEVSLFFWKIIDRHGGGVIRIKFNPPNNNKRNQGSGREVQSTGDSQIGALSRLCTLISPCS